MAKELAAEEAPSLTRAGAVKEAAPMEAVEKELVAQEVVTKERQRG